MLFSSWLRNWKTSHEPRSTQSQARRRSSPARRFAPRPELEILEARILLDANPQVQLSSDLAKLALDSFRATLDAAMLASEVAIASGAATPEGIAGLAALGNALKDPGRVVDAVAFLKDAREGNKAGMVADLLSLTGKTLLAIGGDLIALRLDGLAIANDLAHIRAGTPIPESSPVTTTPHPPSHSPSSTTYSGTISGSFTSYGDVDQEGRGFFGSNLGGKGAMTATPSPNGGYDVSGSFQLTQAQPDFLGPDNFAGNYGFSLHVASLSGSVLFDATGSDVTLACTGGFSSNGSFGGFWVLVAGDQDDSDSGNGNFSLN